ncbi:FHA domain-containing protein [Agromyces sp. CF514]|uniref:DUF5684 domain-containing protein n=1 Tax=Agromyces sp. CF514 TaxID=1881031 RepID=UPI0008EFAA39|nr:DUF5684 domain-containing protein [Agromyces sp. CF514]SFR68207.1 FHA domain-containing protein [Agromyces sp. CF514]
MTPADAQQLAAVTMAFVAISCAIGLGLYVWYAVMLSKVFAHAGLRSWSAWVPVYNQMQVFRLGGQHPLLALLLYVPIAQVVGLVFLVMALHRISGQYWRGVGTTVLGVLLPPVWATVIALGPSPDPERGRMPVRGASAGSIPPVAPGGPLSDPVATIASGWNAPCAAPVAAPRVPVTDPGARHAGTWPAGDSAPILPAWADLHPRGIAPAEAAPAAAAPTAAAPVPAAWQAAMPAAPSAFAGPVASAAPVAPAVAAAPAPTGAPVGSAVSEPVPRIPGRIEPLPAAPVASAAHLNAAPPLPDSAVLAGPALPSLPPVAAAPTFEPAASAAAAAVHAAPPVTALAVPVVTGAVQIGEAQAGPDDLDEDPLDRTVVVARKPLVTWRLVPESGEPLVLLGDVVLLGRSPRTAGVGESRLVVPDPSRTLSKTHAVLRLEGEAWSITDLASTNGVLVADEMGVDRLLDAGVPTPVPDRFVLGTLAVRIERNPPHTGIHGR